MKRYTVLAIDGLLAVGPVQRIEEPDVDSGALGELEPGWRRRLSECKP